MKAYMLDYLANQKHLEELALRDLNLDDASSLGKIKEFHLPLKKLALGGDVSLFRNEESELEFFGKFVGTLEELEFGNSSESAFKLVFKAFSKLKVLSVNVSRAPSDDEFYQKLRPNNSVKKLIIRYAESRLQKRIEGIIGCLPNIETLVLETDDMPDDLLQFISNNLLRLQNLHLRSISGAMLKRVNIGSLKSLHVAKLDHLLHREWKKIVKAFPNVEKFTVGVADSYSLSDRMFNIFTHGWRKLSHLKLGQGFIALNRVFKLMLRNCKNLKKVEVLKDAFKSKKSEKDKILSFFKKDGLRFIIHPDETFNEDRSGLWQSEECTENFDESDSESLAELDDEDWNDGEDFEDLFPEAAMGLMGMLQMFGNGYNSDSDDEYVNFDSDGEMQHWNEDPGDHFDFLD